jgi:hypothetical protein
MTYLVSFYEIDSAYGGPEEGGWYFECGDLRRTFAAFPTEAKADAACLRANDLLRVIQRNKRDVGSVIYGGGRHSARVHQNTAPAFFPANKPTYE